MKKKGIRHNCIGCLLAITWIMASAPSSLSIQTSGNEIDPLSDLTQSQGAKSIAKIILNSTHDAGFSLTLNSLKNSHLIRFDDASYTSAIAGNKTAYTIDMVPAITNQGTLGCQAPTLPLNTSLSSDITLTYLPQVPTQNTVDYVYFLRINTQDNKALFRGSFRDDLTLTLSDL